MTLTSGPVQDDLTVIVEKTLRSLRISGHLIGLQYLVAAVSKAVKDPLYPLYVTKKIYPEIAFQFSSSDKAVERAIRTAIRSGWELGNSAQLEEIAGYPLKKFPTNAMFIDLVATHIRYDLHK